MINYIFKRLGFLLLLMSLFIPLSFADDPCDATFFPICGGTATETNNQTATPPDPILADVFSCGSNENTVWSSFTAPASGNATIDTEGSDYDTQMSIMEYTGGGDYCTDFGGFVEVGCDEDGGTGSLSSVSLTGLTPGQTYYIAVDGFAGATGTLIINLDGDTAGATDGGGFCCGPGNGLDIICIVGDEDNFYVDLTLTDLGTNPSGFEVNGGTFPDITAPGTYQLGPFANGTDAITLVGLLDPNCVVTFPIEGDCSCDPDAVNPVITNPDPICPGDDYILEAFLDDVILGECLGTYVVSATTTACPIVPEGATTPVTTGDDTGEGPFPIPFDFEFFCNTYTDFYISSNGYVTFGGSSSSLSNGAIPGGGGANNFIALYWDDLDPPEDNGMVFYFVNGVSPNQQLVIEFQDVQHFPGGSATELVNGQIIINENGTITITCTGCFADGGNGSGSATQGIENSDGTVGYFDPQFPDGQTTDDLVNCVTFEPEYTQDRPCTFVEWLDDTNTSVGTTNPLIVTPSVTTTYTAVVDCEGIFCTTEIPVFVEGCCNDVEITSYNVYESADNPGGGIGPFYYNLHEIIITGGTPPYYYTWSTEGYVRNATVGMGVLNIIYSDNATWSVTITDANGCTEDINGNPLIVTNDPDDPGIIMDIYDFTIGATTAGSMNGTVDIFVEGGRSPYIYEWAGPANWDGTGQGTESLSNCPSGWYSVTVTDGNGTTTQGWYWVPETRGGGRGKVAATSLDVMQSSLDGSTLIQFASATTTKASIGLFSLAGYQVIDLHRGTLEAGMPYQLSLNENNELPAGMYIVRLQTATGEVMSQKVLIQ